MKLRRIVLLTSVFCLLVSPTPAEVVKEDNVFPMIPSGAPMSGMIIEKPKEPLAKPTGST